MRRAILLILLAGCGQEVSPAACNIDGVAYQWNDLNPLHRGYGPIGLGAQYCDPDVSRTQWTCYTPGYETTACGLDGSTPP